jgi:23S rRNA (adenine2503-C2)-methyltransferase
MFSIHDEAAVQQILPANGSRPLLYRKIERAIYKDRLEDLSGLEAFPPATLAALQSTCRRHELAIRQTVSSANGETTRFLLAAADGAPVESVIMRHPSGRNTLCLSSQSGCPMACRFCATGRLGLIRDLSAWEMIDQVDLAIAHLARDGVELRNLVFMGMGEPFLNYRALSQALSVLTARTKYQFAHKRITVSTCGLPEGIAAFARDHPLVSLAVSLHAPDDATRHYLMPGTAATPIAGLMEVMDGYQAATGRKVFYEYVMIAGVTDRDAQAEDLARLMAGRLAQVNFIPWNPGETPINGEPSVGQPEFRPSGPERLAFFQARLKAAGVPSTIRVTMGEDIAAACGQLSSRSVNQRP